MPPKKSIKDKLNKTQISIKPQKFDPDDEQKRNMAGFNSPKNAKAVGGGVSNNLKENSKFLDLPHSAFFLFFGGLLVEPIFSHF